MSTLREVVESHVGSPDGDVATTRLVAALVDREDNMADQLRLAGMQFGLYPEIVAEVLAQIGLGTQPDEATRLHIRTQFTTLMQRLRDEYERGQQ